MTAPMRLSVMSSTHPARPIITTSPRTPINMPNLAVSKGGCTLASRLQLIGAVCGHSTSGASEPAGVAVVGRGGAATWQQAVMADPLTQDRRSARTRTTEAPGPSRTEPSANKQSMTLSDSRSTLRHDRRRRFSGGHMQQDQLEASAHPHNGRDGREENLAEREDALDAREWRLQLREAALRDRGERERGLLADADKRDVDADARDVAATRRDMAASVEELLDDTVDTARVRAREAAASDRTHSGADRVASAGVRAQLTQDG